MINNQENNQENIGYRFHVFKMGKIIITISRVSKFVLVAILGLFLTLVVHVVGYSTNFWVIKEISVKYYYSQGLWRECYCGSYCSCVNSAHYTDDSSRMLVIRVLESLGLVSLIVALVLTVIGGVITKRTVVKISAALACFLSCAFISAGVIGVAVTFLSKVWKPHYSFALCAIAAVLSLVCAALLIASLQLNQVAKNTNRQRQEDNEGFDQYNETRQQSNRHNTLAEYLSQNDQRRKEPVNANRPRHKAPFSSYRNEKGLNGTNRGNHVHLLSNYDQKDTEEKMCKTESGGNLNKAQEVDKQLHDHYKDYQDKDYHEPKTQYLSEIHGNAQNGSYHSEENQVLRMRHESNQHNDHLSEESKYLSRRHKGDPDKSHRSQKNLYSIERHVDNGDKYNLDQVNQCSKQRHVNDKYNKFEYVNQSNVDDNYKNYISQKTEYPSQSQEDYRYEGRINQMTDYSHQYHVDDKYKKDIWQETGYPNQSPVDDRYNSFNQENKHQNQVNVDDWYKNHLKLESQYLSQGYEFDQYNSQTTPDVQYISRHQKNEQIEYKNRRDQGHHYTKKQRQNGENNKVTHISNEDNKSNAYSNQNKPSNILHPSYEDEYQQLYVVLPETKESIWPCSKSKSQETYVRRKPVVNTRHTNETEV